MMLKNTVIELIMVKVIKKIEKLFRRES